MSNAPRVGFVSSPEFESLQERSRPHSQLTRSAAPRRSSVATCDAVHAPLPYREHEGIRWTATCITLSASTTRRSRRNDSPAFKAKVALAALKGRGDIGPARRAIRGATDHAMASAAAGRSYRRLLLGNPPKQAGPSLKAACQDRAASAGDRSLSGALGKLDGPSGKCTSHHCRSRRQSDPQSSTYRCREDCLVLWGHLCSQHGPCLRDAPNTGPKVQTSNEHLTPRQNRTRSSSTWQGPSDCFASPRRLLACAR